MTPTHVRFGASSLATSAVLFAIFPLVRPYFRLDPLEPVATLGAAGPAVASTSWVLAHAIAMTAFVLLLVSLPVLYGVLARAGAEPRAWRAMLTSLGGIALVMPTLGVETYVLPAIGRLYLDGRVEIAPMIGLIYRGPTTLVLLLGLVLLAVGAITFAGSIRRSGVLSGSAGVLLAGGLTFWLPLLPPPIRVADGLVIGIGGLWLAWSMGRHATADGLVNEGHSRPGAEMHAAALARETSSGARLP